MAKRNYLIISLFLAAIFLSGCIKINTAPQNQAVVLPLGIFKSTDASQTWQYKSRVLNTAGQVLTIGDVSVRQILFDPSDHNAIYLATDKGLFYSFTGAEDWQQAAIFGPAPINNIAVDYFNKCTVYMVAGQSIYKTTDCLRTWQELYFDKTRPNLQFTVIATEGYNKNVVYVANNLGEILKSLDAGKTWQTIKRINNPLKQILVDKDDTRIIYFVTENAGIFKTTDSGKTWSDEKPETDLNKGLSSFNDSKIIHCLVQDLSQPNSLFLASAFGILKSADGGLTWQSIELITPERGANIYSLAVDPKDNKIIYYGTDSTIYKSVDGGKYWATEKSPVGGAVNILLIDPNNNKIMYLGAKGIKK